MKKKNYLSGKWIRTAFISSILLLSLISCEQLNTSLSATDIEDGASVEYSDSTNQRFCLYNDTLPMEDLSEEEAHGLLFMREEEKLARDLYISLYEIFPLRNLNNISRSEQAHMDAVKYLLDRYGLQDPVADDQAGRFENQYLQDLFDGLLVLGSSDKIAALRAGALVEETDILDLEHELDAVVDNKDIALVYNNLLRGSKNHLRSFVGVLKLNGVIYVPELLGEEAFNDIIEGR